VIEIAVDEEENWKKLKIGRNLAVVVINSSNDDDDDDDGGSTVQ
jgi:hypothetical protein